VTRPIERATAPLRRGDLTVTDEWFAVGCSSLGTFSTRRPSTPASPATNTEPSPRATEGADGTFERPQALDVEVGQDCAAADLAGKLIRIRERP
jgi:hypothetical protein